MTSAQVGIFYTASAASPDCSTGTVVQRANQWCSVWNLVSRCYHYTSDLYRLPLALAASYDYSDRLESAERTFEALHHFGRCRGTLRR